MTTTVDELVPPSFYVPGLSFRGQIADGDVSIIAHNANGAAQLSWKSGSDPAPAKGMLIVHSPHSLETRSESITKACAILGGPCFATAFTTLYVDGFRHLLATGNMHAVCDELADWHDAMFAHRPVQP